VSKEAAAAAVGQGTLTADRRLTSCYLPAFRPAREMIVKPRPFFNAEVPVMTYPAKEPAVPHGAPPKRCLGLRVEVAGDAPVDTARLGELLAGHGLRLVRVAEARPPAGPRARRERADKRWRAVAALDKREGPATAGRGAWRRILARLMVLHPGLELTRKLPPGASLDTVSPHWLRRHTISPASLRRGFLAWRRHNDAE
jgi:hypothetical protein